MAGVKEMKRSNIGKVYAVHTSKGEGIVQVCADKDELENGINVTQIRVFSQLYPQIPENIDEILQGEEAFRIFCSVQSMTSPRYNMATYLGRYDLPEDFEKTKYFKYAWYRPIDEGPKWTRNWEILEAKPDISLSVSIKITDWIENYLQMDSQKDDWKKIFAELDYDYICNGLRLIERLETGNNPRKFLPTDFDIPSKYLVKETKD